jgi:hypothetical protein
LGVRPLVLTLLAAALAACGSSPAPERERKQPPRERAAERPAGVPEAPAAPKLKRVSCPPELDNCRSASGRIIYVERVDPDGDGDAHFVLISRAGITGPGLSVIDVKRSLRPHPLPGPGDLLSAAGPVYTGSYGQKQIEAIELNVARR